MLEQANLANKTDLHDRPSGKIGSIACKSDAAPADQPPGFTTLDELAAGE